MASFPFGIYHKRTNEQVDTHPFLDALRIARRYHAGQSLLELWQRAKCVHGEAYIEKVRGSGRGAPLALRWLNPIATEPFVLGGHIQYFQYIADEQVAPVAFAPDEVVYDIYHNPLDDLRGLSPLQTAIESVNILKHSTAYKRAYFRNNARPGGILKPAPNVFIRPDDQRRLRGELASQTQGPNKANSMVFMPVSLEFQPIQQQPAPEHQEVSDDAKWTICEGMGVPAPLVLFNENRFQLSPEHARVFYEDTVIPDIEDMQQTINEELIAGFFEDMDHEFRFQKDRVMALMADQQKLSVSVNSRLMAGNLTINEARGKYGEKPIPGGDILFVPKANQPVKADEIETITELPTNAPEAQGMPQENQVPMDDVMRREMKAWETVATKSLTRARDRFRVETLPQGVAERVRELLYTLPETSDKPTIRALFRDADRMLDDFLSQRETAELMARMEALT